ncbi:MAG: AmpG family muropeptide MFS transporter [Oceanospirillaceae bacterium]|nr:AmpG family muropeptide MFS transporter [Oceanospirillaceae bacterium]|tara:strand:- start:9574 stop:10980 length:1407 start_codon:yes stop_codon:yes gene_type:complete
MSAPGSGPDTGTRENWLDALRVYTRKPVLVITLLGFAAGLPYLLVFSTLTAWLNEEGVSKTAIGFFAWVGLTYSVKVFWSPVVDRLRLPLLTSMLGQRRSWMLLAQTGIAAGLLWMSHLDPQDSLWWIAFAAVLVAFSSSTHDVALDAFRIECAPDEEQGALAAGYILGYRLALLMSGAGALYIAALDNWPLAYQSMALLMGLGMLAVFWSSEPAHNSLEERRRNDALMVDKVMGRPMHLDQRPFWQHHLLGAVICPFLEFFQRYGPATLVFLLFIAVYRLSDITMGIMANPFYLDLGYSKSEIASVAKIFGFFMTIGGAVLCGVLVAKMGILRPLLLGAVCVALTNVLFALMAMTQGGGEPSLLWLGLVISADNLSGGIAITAFIAFLSSLTNRNYTATQYALFSSLMTLPGKFVSGFSGWVVDGWGYAEFFVVASLLGLPAIVLVLWLMRRNDAALLPPSSDQSQA